MKMENVIKLIIVALIISSCSGTPLKQNQYRIIGTVTGLDKGEIYLNNYPEMDTIQVVDGKFLIENSLKEPVSQITLFKDPGSRGMEEKTYLQLMVEPKIMNLTLNYADFSKSKLTGSKAQDDEYKLETINENIAKNYKEERAAFDKVSKKYRDAKASGASEEALESIKDEDDAAKAKLEPMGNEQRAATLTFIKENPKSYVSVYMLLFFLSDMKYEEAKPLYDSFDPKYTNTELGKRVLTEIENMKKGIPGALAGDFNTVDINGKPIKLSDFKGKYLLIDFWASWCGPCRKGSPHLLNLYAKYKSKGLEILGVSDDQDTNAWRKAVEKDKTGVWSHVLRGLEYRKGTYVQINKDKDISAGYNIHTLPTKILIGPDGIIIGRYNKNTDEETAELDKKLEDILK